MSTGKQHGPPRDASRCLPDVEHVSSVVRGYRDVSQRNRKKEREREKSKTQIRTTAAAHQSFYYKRAPSFHSVLASKGNNGKVDRTGHQ